MIVAETNRPAMRLFVWFGCIQFALSSIVPAASLAQPSSRTTLTRIVTAPVGLVFKGGAVELFDPSGVLLLSSGGVLFADREPVTVRVTDPKSGIVQHVARSGGGPGEFRAAPSFVGFVADSLAAYDAMQRRWTILGPTGAFGRILNSTDPIIANKQSAVRVYHRAMVFNASLASSAPSASAIRAIVATMPATAGGIVVHQFSNGQLWAADEFDSRQWHVFDRQGAHLSGVIFDRSVRVTSVRDRRVIGTSLDEDEIPVIVSGSLPEWSPQEGRQVVISPPPPLARSVAARSQLGEFLQSMVPLQEKMYVDGARYTTSISKLNVPVPPSVEVRILQATDRGWFAVGTDTTSSVTCAIGVGFAVIGWDEGKAFCSER